MERKNINTQSQIERNDLISLAYLAHSMTPVNYDDLEQEALIQHQANEDLRLSQ
jgi:hypothetical protein